jgi:hypothetical protein
MFLAALATDQGGSCEVRSVPTQKYSKHASVDFGLESPPAIGRPLFWAVVTSTLPPTTKRLEIGGILWALGSAHRSLPDPLFLGRAVGGYSDPRLKSWAFADIFLVLRAYQMHGPVYLALPPSLAKTINEIPRLSSRRLASTRSIKSKRLKSRV